MIPNYDKHPKSNIGLEYLGLESNNNVHWNLTPAELYEKAKR